MHDLYIRPSADTHGNIFGNLLMDAKGNEGAAQTVYAHFRQTSIPAYPINAPIQSVWRTGHYSAAFEAGSSAGCGKLGDNYGNVP